MLIQWRGVGERSAYGATWQNGSVAEVLSASVAAELLTQPGERFTVASDDPLAQIVGEHAASLAALCSVFTVADLAALDEAGVQRVMSSVGMVRDTVEEWAEKAREA